MVRFSIIVAVCITMAVVCFHPVSFANSAPASHYVRHEKKDGVIIFVHGIFGDPTDTWTCPKGTYWPTLLLKDTSFKDYDVYVASYDSPRLGNGMTIDEVVLNLHNRFENDQVFQHRKVVFVAHSLGGLIVQRLILKYREYAPKVRFIYFFATPESGAQIAKLGSYFSRDPLLKEMLDGDENDYLLNLETDWREANFQNAHRFSAYEKKPTRIGMIVDRLSATRGCEHTLPINEDVLLPANLDSQGLVF
jgi:pimeloyl-ACP methyl ester carboxylesterase